MNPRPLDIVVDLYRNLTKLGGLEEQLEGIPDWMQELHEEYSGRKSEIDELRSAVEEAREERRAAEIETEDLTEKLKHYQEQIGMVRTQREYGALLQEIDLVKASMKELEEKALAAMERQDDAQKKLDEGRQPFEEIDQRYSAELAKWDEQKPAVRQEVEALRLAIQELREALSPGHLLLFERVHDRLSGGLAQITPVERPRGPLMWHCAACHYRVRPQVVAEVRNEASLRQCDSCKRILYFSEDGA